MRRTELSKACDKWLRERDPTYNPVFNFGFSKKRPAPKARRRTAPKPVDSSKEEDVE